MDLHKRFRRDTDKDRSRPADRRPAFGPDAAATDTAGERLEPGSVEGDPASADARDRAAGAGFVPGGQRAATPSEADTAAEDKRYYDREDLHRPTTPTPVAAVDDPATRGYPATAADDRLERPDREVVDEVVVRRWSFADAVITAVGAAMAAVGIIGLIRAEINDTWYQPVVQVVRADHTPLLAALEVGVGGLIALCGIFRQRILATLLGVGVAVAGAIGAIQTAEVSRELALEDWWGWVLCGAGVVVALMALVPRKARVERVVRPETARQAQRSGFRRRTRVA